LSIASDMKYVDVFRKLYRLEPLVDTLGIFNPVVGDWYPSAILSSALPTAADFGADILMACWYPIFRKCRFDRIAIDVPGAGAAGARARLGLYDDLNYYPNNLLFDAGEADVSAVGMPAITIDRTLSSGRYWIAFILNDATVDLKYATEFLYPRDRLGYSLNAGWRIAQTYGALPSTFPAGATNDYRLINLRLRVAEVY